MKYSFKRRWLTNGTFAAVAALVLAATAPGVAAQAFDPDSCSAAREQVTYLTGVGDFVQQAGLHEGIDLLAENQQLVDLFCDPAIPVPNDPAAAPPNPAQSDPAATAPTAVVAPATPPAAADDDNSLTRRDACVLLTESEVGIAMKQAVAANEDDPAGFPGAQGCQFSGAGSAYTNVMYVQANSAFFYQSFHDTAEANGVQTAAGLGDRAFSYMGDNGPGVVVVKGDKLFAIEFNGVGDGPTERTSLLTLAQQAVNRVH